MTTALVLNSEFSKHVTREGHPECPERNQVIQQTLSANGLLERCMIVDPEAISRDILLLNHSEEYVRRLELACEAELDYIDSEDSSICPQSMRIAELAAGSTIKALRTILEGKANNAFCVLRPPGHHAERNLSMGFCLFNNVAIAAHYLIKLAGFKRVLIFDWDVHHGNGTQHSFEEDPRVLYCSIHGDPRRLYPGTGLATEVGKGAGLGFTLNVPLNPDTDDTALRGIFSQQIKPKFESFNPDFILLSAGFDAHRDDPLGNLAFETDTFEWLTKEMMDLAKRHCGSRLLSVLEGGYNLNRLAECASVHLRTLLEGDQ